MAKHSKHIQKIPKHSKKSRMFQNMPKHDKRNPANSETIQKKLKNIRKTSQSEKMERSHRPDMVQYLHFRILKFPLMG